MSDAETIVDWNDGEHKAHHFVVWRRGQKASQSQAKGSGLRKRTTFLICAVFQRRLAAGGQDAVVALGERNAKWNVPLNLKWSTVK